MTGVLVCFNSHVQNDINYALCFVHSSFLTYVLSFSAHCLIVLSFLFFFLIFVCLFLLFGTSSGNACSMFVFCLFVRLLCLASFFVLVGEREMDKTEDRDD